MSNFKSVHSQMRKSLSRPVTTSNTTSSRKSITGSKTSIPHDVFSPISKKSFGLNSSNTKEETLSPAFSTLASSKALNRTDRLSQGQDSFSTAVDAFKNARRESIMSLKWGDASTKASSLASLNGTLTSIPKIKSRTTFTAQSLSVLPSEAPSLVSMSHANRFFNTNNAAQSLNDVETKKHVPGSELTSRNDLLTDREYESNLGGTLNNLEEKFDDLEEINSATSLQREEMCNSKKAVTDRPRSNSKRGKINSNYVITTTTPRLERKSSAQKQRPVVKKEKGSNDTSTTKIKKRKSVIIVKKEKNVKSGSKKVKSDNKSEIPLVPLAKQFSSEKSPVKIFNEPRSAGKIDLSKVIQTREIQDNQSVTSPRFDSTRLETMDEVQETSTSRSSIQPKFIVRRDFAGSQSLRKRSLEKLEVPAPAKILKSPAKEVFLNKPLETILSNFHETTDKSMDVKTKTEADIRIDTITSLDDNIPVQNVVFENPKITKKKEVMNWFKDKLNAPEDAEKKVNVKVLEIISRRNHWRKVEEEAENRKSEASPDVHPVFKSNGSNFLELNMENKFIKEYSSASHQNKNIAGRPSFGERKDVRSNSSTMMVRHFDEFDPVVIQPKFMEETGSMCFTELWGKKSKNEFYKTMRKAFQSNTFVSLEPHCGLHRPEKGLTSEELMCRRIANGGISMTERRLSVKIPEDMGMTLSKKEHFSPRGGIGKHTRAFVLQGAGRVKQGTKNNFGSV